MPTYQYQCKNCGHELEELQSMTEPPLVRCPNCKNDTLVRVISSGSGLIFKGSGFYLTDYKKSGSSEEPKPAKKKEEKKTDSSPPPTPPESKPSSDGKTRALRMWLRSIETRSVEQFAEGQSDRRGSRGIRLTGQGSNKHFLHAVKIRS